MRDGNVQRLADLAVEFGANVQPDQVVYVGADTDQIELARAVAEAAYERGARFVDVRYFDSYVKRSRLLHAREETLAYVPPWYGETMLALGREQAALIRLTPIVRPGLLTDVDPARSGKDRLPVVKEALRIINDRSVNWTIVPCPTPAWARAVHPELEPDAALEQLWGEVIRVCRLDEEDPVAAWKERHRALDGIAGRLNERRFEALHFEGPGTDLTVGLLPTSTWPTAIMTRSDGVRHMVNIPSEETFTAPDPQRVDGVVRSTRPLDLTGTVVDGLVVRFEGGRAVSIEADRGAEALRARCGLDDGAARLGEVALVDRESRVGQLGVTFAETLLDENATSHLAFGNGYELSVGEEDLPSLNRSEIHVDFMIGGDDVDVTGITRDGDRVPVLRAGGWAL